MSIVKSKIREIYRICALDLYKTTRNFHLNPKYIRIFIYLSLDKRG